MSNLSCTYIVSRNPKTHLWDIRGVYENDTARGNGHIAAYPTRSAAMTVARLLAGRVSGKVHLIQSVK